MESATDCTCVDSVSCIHVHTRYINWLTNTASTSIMTCTPNFIIEQLSFQADAVFNEPLGDRPLRERLADTAELASQILELTAPGLGASLLPVDLNSTNSLIDGIVSLLNETLDTTENVTGLPDQVYNYEVYLVAIRSRLLMHRSQFIASL